jgi:hypothetical protein
MVGFSVYLWKCVPIRLCPLAAKGAHHFFTSTDQTMKHYSFALTFVTLLFVSTNLLAQHADQYDDGAGHYSTLHGSSTGGTYTLPTISGTLLASNGSTSTVWLLGGNTGAGANNQLGTLDGTALNFVTAGVGNVRMSIGSTGIISMGGGSQLTVSANGNITKVNNVTTSFPSSQGSAGSVLTNDGTGVLTWAIAGSNSADVASSNNQYAPGGSSGPISGNQANLPISSTATFFKVDVTPAGSSYDVDGIDATGTNDGRVVYFANVSTNAASQINFRNQNAGATAANRFLLPGGFDVTIGAGSIATFIYDGTAQRWRLVSSN